MTIFFSDDRFRRDIKKGDNSIIVYYENSGCVEIFSPQGKRNISTMYRLVTQHIVDQILDIAHETDKEDVFLVVLPNWIRSEFARTYHLDRINNEDMNKNIRFIPIHEINVFKDDFRKIETMWDDDIPRTFI